MKPIIIVPSTAIDDPHSGYDTRAEAEKALRALPPGSYNIVRLLEVDVLVQPPEPTPTHNVVVPGTRLVERARKSKE